MDSGYFIFDGLDTRTLGVEVFPVSLDTAPHRNFQTIDVPGRHGIVILDNEKYGNVERSYYVLIRSDPESTYQELRGFLLSRKNYCKLSDSWFPDEHYLAYVSQDIKPKYSDERDMCKFIVTFSRKPQRFLVSGDTGIEIPVNTSQWTSVITIPSETYFPAHPLIIVSFNPDTAANVLANRNYLIADASLSRVVSGAPQPQAITNNYYYLDTGDDNVPLSQYISTSQSIAIDTESKSAYIVGTQTYLNNIFIVSSGYYQSGYDSYSKTSTLLQIPAKDSGWKYTTTESHNFSYIFYPRWYTI